jgi:uncharacterized protein YjbI with pentapeptide repeats
MDSDQKLPQNAAHPELTRPELAFSPNSDLTYKTLQDVRLENLSLRQSLLTGSILRGCSFREVDFSRCDLDGVRIEQCAFVDCNFEGADLRSSVFSGCELQRVQFEGVLMTDCSFTECSFMRCILNGVITRCLFSASTIEYCSLEKSSTTLNKFSSVSFTETVLGDCTFLYNITLECCFERSVMNAESLGMTFGLTREDIKNLNLVFLGQAQTPPNDFDIIDLLLDSYTSRGWVLGLTIMRLNFGLTSIVYALREYFRSFFALAREGRIIKSEEIQFLSDIMSELRTRERLPFLNVIETIEESSNLLSALEGTDSVDPRTEESVVRMSNALFLSMHQMLDDFNSIRVKVDEEFTDRPAELTLKFTQRPEIPVSQLISSIVTASGLPAMGETFTMETREGSFIEILCTTVYSVVGLQIFLFLLNGCLIQVTELKARIQVLSRRRLPSAYLKNASTPNHEMPRYLVKPLQSIIGYVAHLEWLSEPKLKGFSVDSIIEAEMKPTDKASRKAKRPKRQQKLQT